MTRLTHEQLNPPIDVRDATEGDGIVFRDGVFTAEPVLGGAQPNIGFSGARVHSTANQTITVATPTPVNFDAEIFDTENYHDNSTNNTRLTAPADGYYEIGASILWEGYSEASVTDRQIQIRVNDTTYVSNNLDRVPISTTANTGQETSTVVFLSAGDYVEVDVYHTSGSPGGLDVIDQVSAGQEKSPIFWISRLGTTGGQSNLLGEVVLTADAANIEIANIPGTYKDLRVECSLKSDRSGVTSHDSCRLQVGNGTVDTGSNYRWAANRSDLNLTTTVDNNSSTSDTDITQGTAYGMVASNGSNSHADAYASSTIILTDYASGDYKQVRWDGGSPVPANATSWLVRNRGVWNSTSAIDIIRLTPEVGTNWKAGSVVRVYGEPVLGGGSGLVKGDYLPGDLYLGGQVFENEAATGRTELYAIGGADSPVPEWISYLTTRQSGETPHIDDDFFTDGTAAGTSITPTGTAVWSEGRGYLSGVVDSLAPSDVAVRAFPLTPTSAPVTIEAAIRLMPTNGDMYWGLCFTDGTATSSNFAGCGFQLFSGSVYLKENGGTVTNMTSINNSIDVLDSAAPPHRFYVRCVWTAANTFENSWSMDGNAWSDFGAGSFSVTMTPTHFGPYVGNQGGTADAILSVDYLRVYDSDLSV